MGTPRPRRAAVKLTFRDHEFILADASGAVRSIGMVSASREVIGIHIDGLKAVLTAAGVACDFDDAKARPKP